MVLLYFYNIYFIIFIQAEGESPVIGTITKEITRLSAEFCDSNIVWPVDDTVCEPVMIMLLVLNSLLCCPYNFVTINTFS